MEAYAQVLNIAIPVFILLILIEYWIGRSKDLEIAYGMDVISSLSSGLSNIIKDVLELSVTIVSYTFLVTHLAHFDVPNAWWVYLITFVGLDFAGYWSHRFEHTINIFWNRHIVHHSSEEFNLACALRQPVSNIIKIFFFLLIPLAIIGVPPIIIAVMAPLHLFAQFWYHTRLIDKLGWLEYVIVTPSHHRVHHAINDEYLDKNYAPIFIGWDHLFGTFQAELENVPPVYGVKRPVQTWNPFIINFQHFFLMLRDAWYTKSWKEKLVLWFQPTGYRPIDVVERFPVEAIEDVYNFDKYRPTTSYWQLIWFWIQLVIISGLMLYLFNHVADYNIPMLIWYAVFLWLSIFSLTSSMDRSKWAIGVELLRIILASGLIYYLGDWFGLNSYFGFGTYIFVIWLVLSMVMIVFILALDARKDKKDILLN